MVFNKKVMKKYFKLSILALALMTGVQQANAQNGEQLFKSKCNTCHAVDKNSTGPLLKGVKQKWADAGEAEMLYDWVKNAPALLASGKSQMAKAIESFSPSNMSPQTATKEEVDAILDYVDNYTAPVAAAATPVTGDPKAEVTVVQNYEDNLTLFYWLLATVGVLLITIVILSTSISTLLKSDFFKRKLMEKNAKQQEATEKGNNSAVITTILALVGTFGLMMLSNPSQAMTFVGSGESEEASPWLKVESIDLYFMVGINLVLLGVVLYLRRMFRDCMEMIKNEEVVEVPVATQTIKKLNTILTDVVPIEEEHTILMHHEYDGIRELDNNLPPWWVWGFYATIIFGIIYIFNYHILGTADLQIKEYDKEMAQAKKDIDAYLSKMAMNVDETNATLLTEASDLSAGKAIFSANCIACHKENGGGDIGPNLTDNHWIYGPDVKNLFKVIKMGTPNGMPEHASKLNPVQIQQVSSYVLSLPDVTTGGKEPQGDEYDKEGKAVK